MGLCVQRVRAKERGRENAKANWEEQERVRGREGVGGREKEGD